MIGASRSLVWLFLPVALALYAYSAIKLGLVPRPREKDLLSVAIPAPVQVILAGGDRFLAANLAVLRALAVGGGELDRATYQILGRVQSDAARLNPAHEDNYYISQAILPWNGEVNADLSIQQAATAARPWDAMPPFFLGFDYYYFLHDSIAGGQNLQIAAQRSPPGNREAVLVMAAHWTEKSDDPRVAIGIIDAMAKGTRDRELKHHLEARIERLQGLALLRDAAKLFAARERRPPADIAELLGPGLLVTLPADPLGQGYALDKNGVPIIAAAMPAKIPERKTQ